MSIDGQHFVIVPQFSIFGCQTTRQQVQDENSTLIRLADEFDAERLCAMTLHQRHLQDRAGVVIGWSVAMGTGGGLGGSGRGRVIRPLIPQFEAFLLHDSEPDEGRLLQHRDGPGVGNWSQNDVIHLDTWHQREETTPSVGKQLNKNTTVYIIHMQPLEKDIGSARQKGDDQLSCRMIANIWSDVYITSFSERKKKN